MASLFKNSKNADDELRIEKKIRSLVGDAEISGEIDHFSGETILRILEFHNRLVREIMVPRREIIAVDCKVTIDKILDTIIEHGYTRVPVYSDNVDNIVGILNVKNILKYWSKPLTEKEILNSLHKPYFIPETKKTLPLLHELNQRKYHMAIVIDEYGGTAGLVTLEDLLEEIVGEIHDEYDVDEEGLVEVAGGYVLADCRLEVEKVEDYFGIKLPEGRYKTLAGLIISIVKKIPVAGEIVRVAGLEIVIEAADERSIKKVKITKYIGREV